jgi:hypothetical protein
MEQLGLGLDSPGLCRLDVLETTAYARCPREYFYRYVDRSTHTASGPLVVRGRVLHSVMAHWMSLLSPERTDSRLLDAWRTANASAPESGFEESLRWWCMQPLARAAVHLTEHSVQAALGGFLVHGRLDAVVGWEDRLWVLDYKLRQEELPEEVVWDQVVLLAAAMRKQSEGFLSKPTTLAYVYFEQRTIEALSCEGSNTLETLLSQVIDRARRLHAREYHARPGSQCTECGARWRCDLGGFHR